MAASSSIAASAPTAVHSNNNQWYDVFLNHRGPDTKKTFARNLYLRLLEHRVIAFLDQHELQKGYDFPAQINHAISTASVHVAILSPGYAESTWCLKELVSMLDSGFPIIPVYYGVKPAEVRWTKYPQALQKLEGKKTYDRKTRRRKPRHNSKAIESWRNALSRVADIMGFELACKNGEEVEPDLAAELVDKVVKRILELLKKKPDLHVAQFPTGLHEKWKDFEDTVLLQQQPSGRSQVFGIWGLGGMGKTTLAKEIFNKKKSDYLRCCFLNNVKDHAAKGTLNRLQVELIKSLTSKMESVHSVDEGQGLLIEPLKSRKAFVILDDVDNVNQVEALLPRIHNLHSESLILITCRDKQILISSRVENSSIYRLTGLNPQHSRALFCSYAFCQSYPTEGFEDFVDKFLEVCDGLPLSLKVFGALLYGSDKSDWEDKLGSLKQILPSDIHNTFMITYNSLNTQEQQIFLDIACFFIGKNRDTAIEIWDKSGWRGRQGFQNLQNKCFVEVDEWNQIDMHDQVRDLRISLAEDSSPRRLWRETNNMVQYLLTREIKLVRGLRIVGEEDASDFTDTEYARLEVIFMGLQILYTENALLQNILPRVKVPNLMCLRWKKCPYSSLPSWVQMKELRLLDVSKSEVHTLWQRKDESQELPVCLEELVAASCVKLMSIQGLEQSTKLRLLDVTGCSDLEDLPSMETWVSLEELLAESCPKLKSIRGLEQCRKLRLLYVSGCSKLEELSSLETLSALKELLAEECVNLKSIQGLEQSTKLRRLYVSGCSKLEKLSSLENLPVLEELWTDECLCLKSIQGLEQSTKLRILNVTGCSHLENLPSMERLVSLEELVADACVSLKSIRGLEQSTKLRLLYVSRCSKLEELSSLETLPALEELRAKECASLKSIRGLEQSTKSIRGLEQSTKLRLLYVSGCSKLEELSSLETLPALEDLRAEECVSLKSIRGLEQSTKLRLLYVSGCSKLEELSSLETLPALEDLRAEECVSLKSIRGLKQLTKLRVLFVSGCSKLEELSSLDNLPALEELWTDECLCLKSLQGLEQSTKLRILNVTRCSHLENLPSMERLVSLEEFKAGACVSLKSIRGLEQSTKLRLLCVSGCSKLEELSVWKHCQLWRSCGRRNVCP